MAARNIRVTMNFALSPIKKVGWEESWDRAYDDSIPIITIQDGDAWTLVQKRIAICGLQTTMVSYKTTVVGQKRIYQSYTFPEGGLTNVVGLVGDQDRDWQSDEPDVGLLVSLTDISATQHSTRILKGLPDGIDKQGGQYDPNGAAGWQSRFNAFRNEVKGQWGWLGTDRSGIRTSNVTDVTSGNGFPIITTAQAMFTGPEVGKRLKVSISGVKGAAIVNGQHVVNVLSTTTCQLIKQTPIFTYIGPSGQLTALRNTIVVVDRMEAKYIATREAGSPLPRGHGRSKSKVLA